MIEIPLSKNKLILAVVGSMLFVLLGVWLFVSADSFGQSSTPLLRNPLVVQSAAVLAVLCFGVFAVVGIKKLFDKNIGLALDASGLFDNSSAVSVGFVDWNDVTRIETQQVMSTKFVLIHVQDPGKYIARADSAVKAKLMQSNTQMYGTPIAITANTLKCDFAELERLIVAVYGQRRAAG